MNMSIYTLHNFHAEDKKSLFLIMIVFSFGSNIAIIKSNKDTRYGLDSIVTHDGVKLPCWALPNLLSFKQKFGLDAYEQVMTFC